MAILPLFLGHPATKSDIWPAVALVPVIYVLLRCLYRVYLHPLSRVPGPVIAKCTSLWLSYHSYIGDECATIRKLHERYGPVMRVAPNDVDIAEGEALWPIYMEKGGFAKPDYYSTFDLDGHASIFSSLSLPQRETQAKAVLPIFSMASIRSATDLISACGEKFVACLEKAAEKRKPVNLLHLTRAFALDAVSAYVFQQSYGALDEQDASENLSVACCVDAFISDSIYFYLPRSLTSTVQLLVEKFRPDQEVKRSIGLVDQYLQGIVKTADKTSGSFESRLLDRQITTTETAAQCKDALFAGTDSTGNVLAHICWFLAKHPDKYVALKREVLDNSVSDADLVNLPYLTGVIKEALRLTMTISIRLPRVVPPRGWSHGAFSFPAGTNVGVAAYQLHLDPAVFPSPHEFLPERWLTATSEMHRDWLPFGKGARSCLARNLAMMELAIVTSRMVRRDVLKGARVTEAEIAKYEWFFSRIKGDRIELVWDGEGK